MHYGFIKANSKVPSDIPELISMAEQLEYFRIQMLRNYPEYIPLSDFKDNETLLPWQNHFYKLDLVTPDPVREIKNF